MLFYRILIHKLKRFFHILRCIGERREKEALPVSELHQFGNHHPSLHYTQLTWHGVSKEIHAEFHASKGALSPGFLSSKSTAQRGKPVLKLRNLWRTSFWYGMGTYVDTPLKRKNSETELNMPKQLTESQVMFWESFISFSNAAKTLTSTPFFLCHCCSSEFGREHSFKSADMHTSTYLYKFWVGGCCFFKTNLTRHRWNWQNYIQLIAGQYMLADGRMSSSILAGKDK